ncbi:MAG: adenylate/guanylate cyclase domain-containing protein [Cyanobacteria bacterium SBLK]|nr:adenylate/guanylate cyclase domain-containing protein [Cyanobacteria bacterium SBLK]
MPHSLERSQQKTIWQVLQQWRGVVVTTPSIALLIILLRGLGFVQLLEWALLDRFFQWKPPELSDERIAIVAIDEEDLQEIGQWPISDGILAELLAKIKAQQPRAIGLDLYRDLPIPPGTETLAEVFASTPNLIGIEKVTGDEFGKSVAPPPLLKKSDRVGAADFLFDEDGTIRRALLSLRYADGRTVFSFPVKLALLYLQAENIDLEPLDETGRVRLGKGVFAPLEDNTGAYVNADDRGYQILFAFRAPPCKDCSSFPIVSMRDTINEKIDRDVFRDRVVLIGVSAASVQDRFFTPYGRNFPTAPTGVEIHAHATSLLLASALDDRWLLRGLPDGLEWFWVLCLSGVGAILSGRVWRWEGKVLGIVVAGMGAIAMSYGTFLLGWWLPAITPLLALVGSAIAMGAYLTYVAREDREAVMNLLGQHVSPKIAQAVWNDRYQLLEEGQLVGQQMIATVLFSDIKGFTGITESVKPKLLMQWLNEYMKTMSEVVLEHDGVLDKFIGDAVMAVFGVPLPKLDTEEIARDAKAAVSCAIAMAAKVEELNAHWRDRGLPEVAVRAGIATGEVVAGSLGSRQRLNYTIIGDSVNVASRLESYDKSIDGGSFRILINEETYHCIDKDIPVKYLGESQLKGRSQVVKIYQVLWKT